MTTTEQSKPVIEIKHRYTGKVIRTVEGDTLRGADLRGADLVGAVMHTVDGGTLVGADLRGADLTGADLVGADLRGADLTGANLWGANLWGADLTDAIMPDGRSWSHLIASLLAPYTNPDEPVRVEAVVKRTGAEAEVTLPGGVAVLRHALASGRPVLLVPANLESRQ